jgi:hypothetical protein
MFKPLSGHESRPMSSPVDLRDLPEDRRALVARLRREIADGTYETNERLEGAVEAFLESGDSNFASPGDNQICDEPRGKPARPR